MKLRSSDKVGQGTDSINACFSDRYIQDSITCETRTLMISRLMIYRGYGTMGGNYLEYEMNDKTLNKLISYFFVKVLRNIIMW